MVLLKTVTLVFNTAKLNLLFSQLTTLMLNYNRLAIPHHQWFLTIAINADLPTSFIEVDITDNPWVCDTSSKDYMVSNMPETRLGRLGNSSCLI